MSDDTDWQKNLAGIRMRLAEKNRPRTTKRPAASPGGIGQEAVMTLVAIMQDDSDPRLQIAAAKALLDRTGAEPPAASPSAPPPSETDIAATQDDIDAAIALAKAVLDELASRKAGSLAGAGQLDSEKPREPDHPAG